MRVSFLGFLISDGEVDRYLSNDKNMPVQTHKFGRGFYTKLMDDGVEVVAIHSPPVSRFPSNRFFINRPRKVFNGDYPFGFINLAPFNFIERFFKACYYLVCARNNVVIVHGLYLPYVAAAFLYSLVRPAKLFVVLTDPINVGKHGFLHLPRLINSVLISFFLRRFVASFSVSVPLSRKLMGYRRHLLIPGFFDLKTFDGGKDEGSSILDCGSAFRVCYAGGLEDDYGVFDLVRAVGKISSSDVVLFICGKGSLEDELRKYSDKVSNVRFLGYLPPGELGKLYRCCDLLVNPRVPSADIFKYSFPSKLFDYLSSRKPVLTTKLASIPVEIEGCFYYISEFTEEGISRAILDLSDIEAAELERFGVRAFERVVEYQRSINFRLFIESIL